MPEDPNATPNGGEPGSVDAGKAQEPEGTPGPFLGTYNTREDAEKALAEKDATIGKLSGELGHYKGDVLSKLAEIASAKAQPSQPEKSVDWDEIEKQWEEGDAKFQLSLIKDVIAGTAAKEDVSGVQKQVEERMKLLEQRLQDVQPEYLQHREQVAVLQKDFPGVDRETLVKFAAVLEAERPTAPPADEPPGSTASSRVSAPANKRQMTDGARELLNSVIPGGLRAGELDKVL